MGDRACARAVREGVCGGSRIAALVAVGWICSFTCSTPAFAADKLRKQCSID